MIPVQAPRPDDWFAQFTPNAQSPYATDQTPPNRGPIVDPAQGALNTAMQTAQQPAAPSGGSGDPNAFRDAWYASPYPKTTDGLKQFVAANPQFGAQITGSKGSKVLIGGQAFQAVRSAGINGGIGPAWDPLGAEGGTAGGGSAGGGMLGAMGPWMQPYDKEYALPSMAEFNASPFATAGMDAFNRAQQGSAAAHGTLLNARTNEAMFNSALDRGAQNYGSMALLSKGVYDTNYQRYRNNQTDPFNKAYQTAQLGKPSA